jgi:nucleoside-diphosphate-sugar epimerase
VLRPQMCVGPERRGELELLCRRVADGRSLPLIGPGLNRWQLVDVQDVCNAVLLCLTADRARANDTFNIGAERFGTVREDLQKLLDHAGRGGRLVSLRTRASVLCLRGLEALRLSPLDRWTYETATRDFFVSIRRAVERLGFRPCFSNYEGLLRNYAWYLTYRREMEKHAPRIGQS